MFAASPAVVVAIRDVLPQLPDGETLGSSLDAELALTKPDLTTILLRLSRAALTAELELPGALNAAICRAACRVLAARYPGATIEVRIPPYAACQVGFGSGSRHTRGTPPNVVETDAETFRQLICGNTSLSDPKLRVSGTHAYELAAAFPL